MKPIEKGRYRLRNGHTAKVVEITTVNDVRAAAGFIESTQGDPHEAMEWTAEDGLFGRDPGPWDLVERLPDDESVIQMRLGYWEDVQGAVWKICNHHPATPFPWQTEGGTRGWDGNGKSSWKQGCDLIAFLRPLEDIPPNESVLTILRREHAAMMTIADSHAAVSRQALQSAQEIEHRIAEMERGQG